MRVNSIFIGQVAVASDLRLKAYLQLGATMSQQQVPPPQPAIHFPTKYRRTQQPRTRS